MPEHDPESGKTAICDETNGSLKICIAQRENAHRAVQRGRAVL